MEQAVTEAVRILREGGVILYPTDTVWGIGCDATNAEAVERIYRLKRSENKKSMLVLCATPDMVVRYVHKAPGIAFEVQELATKPLTLILPGASGVAANLIPEEGTLGVRIPDHAFCQAMLRKLGRPIVSTSANISGEDTFRGDFPFRRYCRRLFAPNKRFRNLRARQLSRKHLFDDAVNGQVGITAYRRREMTVVFERKPEVSRIPRRVLRLLHTAKHDFADYALFRRAFYVVQYFNGTFPRKSRPRRGDDRF